MLCICLVVYYVETIELSERMAYFKAQHYNSTKTSVTLYVYFRHVSITFHFFGIAMYKL